MSHGEVLIRVGAAGINRVDAVVRSGHFPLLGEPPFTLAWDVAGVIDSVGPGVSAFSPGQEVLGLLVSPALATPAPSTCWRRRTRSSPSTPGDLANVTMMGATAGHIVEASRSAGVDLALPTAVKLHYDHAIAAGRGGEDFSSLIEIIRPTTPPP